MTRGSVLRCSVALALVFVSLYLISFPWRSLWTCDLMTRCRISDEREYVSPMCNCARRIETVNEQVSNSSNFHWCSLDSDLRGGHQRIISYTLYGDVHNSSNFHRYFTLMRNLSLTAQMEYPGWTIRFYHNFDESDQEAHGYLCDMYCRFPHVDLCSVVTLRERIGNSTVPIDPVLLKGLNRKMYRFLVMLDPKVDVFISRDIDSLIFKREVDAVEQWLQSNYTFHIMRDHANHQSTMLAGMWGAKVFQRRDLIEGLTRALILAGQDPHHFRDQSTLDSIFWPVVRYDVMAHDSYNCENARLLRLSPLKMLPFPSRRDGRLYVGGAGAELYADKCPVQCRPSQHRDWEYC